MTKDESRKFVEEIKSVIEKYEKIGGWRIDYSVNETYRNGNLKFVTISEISLLVDAPN